MVPKGASPRARRNRNPWPRRLKILLALVLMVVLVGVSACIGVALYYTREVQQEYADLEDRLVVRDSVPSLVVDAQGGTLLRVEAEYRKPFKLADVPKRVQEAFIAAEDRRFFDHTGVDVFGLGRAVFIAAREGKTTQGGSTITMQLAKRVTGDERSMDRKIKNIVLAGELENRKSKEQLLELYLRSVYFGEGAYGLASAAEVYFGKDIHELTLGEAAMLARCVRRPSTENPVRDLGKALVNRNVVLSIMQEEGMISKREYDAARRERPELKGKRMTVRTVARSPFFVDYVQKELRERFPDVDLRSGGWRVETTLIPELQAHAEKTVQRWVANNRGNRVSAGAFVIMDRDGKILAEVGGVDYRRSQYNVPVLASLQPGSSFKPFIYAAGLATQKIKPEFISNRPIRLRDQTLPGGYWRPRNDNRGQSAAGYALIPAIAGSVNLPAVHTAMDVGPGKVATFCRDVFGFKSKLYPSPSIALGASNVTMLEMAEGYSVFMLKGDRVRPHPIRRIFAPDGTVFYDAGAQRKSNALSRGVAEMIDEGLRAVVTGGTGRLAAGVPNARGKTGTTTSNKDAWFCGYTDGLVGIGWLGNLDRKPMARGVYGGRVTAGMWADVMTYARERFAPGDPGAKPLVDVDSRPADTLPIAAAAPDRSLDLTGEEAPILVSPPTPRETGPDPDDPLPEIIEDEDPAPVERAVEPAPRTAPEPPVRPRPSPPPADEEMVEVQICADTGKVATDYCPETVGERRARRQVPKSRCELHRP